LGVVVLLEFDVVFVDVEVVVDFLEDVEECYYVGLVSVFDIDFIVCG